MTCAGSFRMMRSRLAQKVYPVHFSDEPLRSYPSTSPSFCIAQSTFSFLRRAGRQCPDKERLMDQ